MERPRKKPLTPDQQVLAAQWVRLAYKLARGRMGPGLDLDDLSGAATEALCHAARCWDPHYGVQFQTYAGRAITSALTGEIARQRGRGLGSLAVAIRNGRLRTAAPLVCEMAAEPFGRERDPAVEAERRDVAGHVRGTVDALPGKIRHMARGCLLGGRGAKSVGAEVGLIEGRADQRLRVGVEMLQERLAGLGA